MQVHFGLDSFTPEWVEAVVCIGTFDGIHLGHQEVIRQAVRAAQESEQPSILVTFDRHPSAVIAPDRKPKAISTLWENLSVIENLGVACVIVLPFNAELSHLSADRFLSEKLGPMMPSQLVVGHDFALGRGREGTTEWLSERLPTQVVPPFLVDGVRVSSSEIRRAVEDGSVDLALKYLGRPFSIAGAIVGGQKLGRKLGFPTANLARSTDQVLPADGVYVVDAETVFGKYRGALNIGTRPSVGGGPRTIEVYLLDYPGNSLYGSNVRLSLLHRIREELNFESLDGLVDQMHADVRVAKDFAWNVAKSATS